MPSSTCLSQPKSLLERVLCDADLHHLACTDYDVMAEKMHREIEEVRGKKIKEQEWNDMNFEFFKNHKFHTDFGQKYLQPIKDDNLKKINGEDPMPENKEVKKLKKKLAKLELKASLKPDRGIETMFRTTSKNHLELSAMADTKANIMISVNTLSYLLLFLCSLESYMNIRT